MVAIEVTQPTPGEPPLHLEVSGLPWPRDGVVSAVVQRSTDGGVRWTTVRGLADVPVPPPPGLHLPGEEGAYASTPDDNALDIVGDIDIRVDFTPKIHPGFLVDKSNYDIDDAAFGLFADVAQNQIFFEWSADGTSDSAAGATSDEVPFVAARQRGTIRLHLDVDDGDGHYVVTWYTGPTVDGPWTPLGDPQVEEGTTSIHASAQALVVGASAGSGGDALGAIVHRIKILSGSTTVVDVDFAAQTNGATSFEDATGLEWTVHGNAEIRVEPPITGVDWEHRPGVVNTYRAGIHQLIATFTRELEDTWGETDTGQEWATVESTDVVIGVTGGEAFAVHEADGAEYTTLLDTPDDIGDVDQAVSFRVGDVMAGNEGASVALLARYAIDGSNYFGGVEISPDGSMLVEVSTFHAGESAGVEEQAALPFSHTDPDTVYRLRMRVDGHRVRAKCWVPATMPEPDWQVEVTVPSEIAVAAGRIGIEAIRFVDNTNNDLTFHFRDYVADIDQPQWIGGTAFITPTLEQSWLCSVMRSFLNRPITIRSYEEPSRAPRGGVTSVAHRTLPIAQAELSGGREWTLELRAADLEEARAIEWIASSGDVLWLLVPAGSPVPGGYYRVGQLTGRHHRQQGSTRWLTLPLVEVAAPGPDIITAQSTWDTVIAQYGTWADVIAAVPTWEALLELIGDPSEVIVDD